MKHQTVLRDEAVAALNLKSDACVVDCTFGGGGHSEKILKELGATGRLLALDADQTAVAAASPAIANDDRVTLKHANFKELRNALAEVGWSNADAILADLGWRSEQFAESGKGFSFSADEPLLMTYGDPEHYLFTAYDIVNDWEESSIADVIFGYGEERAGRKIAAAIVAERAVQPITTARQLAELIETNIGPFYRHSRIHPATKTFQALRIAVNDELGALTTLLNDGFAALAPAGRFAIISFHSLEDRLVKNYFRERAHDHTGRVITKKPITPTKEEFRDNPRARSAKLRILEKV